MRTVILGAGSYAEAIIGYLTEWTSLLPEVALDDDENKHGNSIVETPIVGPLAMLSSKRLSGIVAAVCCIGDNQLRVELNGKAHRAGFVTPGFVHPKASVARTAELGSGVLVLDGAVVQPWCSVGDSCIVSSSVTVAHHTKLDLGVSLASGVTIGASVQVGTYADIGVGANVMTGVRQVGEGAVVGAGATVIRDVPAYVTVAGVPAKPLRTTSVDIVDELRQ